MNQKNRKENRQRKEKWVLLNQKNRGVLLNQKNRTENRQRKRLNQKNQKIKTGKENEERRKLWIRNLCYEIQIYLCYDLKI